jgi:hypothetical protein
MIDVLRWDSPQIGDGRPSSFDLAAILLQTAWKPWNTG